MTPIYEFHVAGRVSSVIRSALPGFVNVGWPHHVRFGWLHPWARLV